MLRVVTYFGRLCLHFLGGFSRPYGLEATEAGRIEAEPRGWYDHAEHGHEVEVNGREVNIYTPDGFIWYIFLEVLGYAGNFDCEYHCIPSKCRKYK